jgi:3-oxoacyl-[acyl-carrier protein] reductase
MRLKGKKAIITGPVKGMGAAISEKIAQEGADVVLAGRDVAPIEKLAAKLRKLGRHAEVVKVDVTSEPDVEAMVKQALAAFDGRIDILVNIAGITGPMETPAWEVTVDAFVEVLQANIVGTFLPIRHVLPTMIRQRSGKIVNIGGTSGMRGYRYRVAYSASKWAIRGLTRTVALDAGEHNINVNAVCPGIVETPRMEKLCREKAAKRGWTYEQVYDEYVQEMALKRVTLPEDVANAVVFMASEDSRQMTGKEVVVDGGWDI